MSRVSRWSLNPPRPKPPKPKKQPDAEPAASDGDVANKDSADSGDGL